MQRETSFSINLPAIQSANPTFLQKKMQELRKAIDQRVARRNERWPEYMILKVKTVYRDNTFDLTTTDDEHTFSRVPAIDPQAKNVFQPGSGVSVRFARADDQRPFIRFGYGLFPSNPVIPPFRGVTGLWPQWEGVPELSLQAGPLSYLGPRWQVGMARPSMDKALVTDFDTNLAIWSSPVIYTQTPPNVGSPLVALAGINVASEFDPDDPGSYNPWLRYFLTLWSPNLLDPTKMDLKTQISLNEMDLYAPFDGQLGGIALQINDTLAGVSNAPTEFMALKVVYVPKRDRLIVLGPAWDVVGRHDCWVLNAQTGETDKKLYFNTKCNVSATVTTNQVVCSYWDSRAYMHAGNRFVVEGWGLQGDDWGGTIERIDMANDRRIHAFSLDTKNPGLADETWTFDPLDLIEDGLWKVLTPCLPSASGRNDKRAPYSSSQNSLFYFVSGGTMTGSLDSPESGWTMQPHGGPWNPFGTSYYPSFNFFWAGLYNQAATQVQATFVVLDADTKEVKLKYSKFLSIGDAFYVDSASYAEYDPPADVGDPSNYHFTYQGYYTENSPLFGCFPRAFPLNQYNSGFGSNALGSIVAGGATVRRHIRLTGNTDYTEYGEGTPAGDPVWIWDNLPYIPGVGMPGHWEPVPAGTKPHVWWMSLTERIYSGTGPYMEFSTPQGTSIGEKGVPGWLTQGSSRPEGPAPNPLSGVKDCYGNVYVTYAMPCVYQIGSPDTFVTNYNGYVEDHVDPYGIHTWRIVTTNDVYSLPTQIAQYRTYILKLLAPTRAGIVVNPDNSSSDWAVGSEIEVSESFTGAVLDGHTYSGTVHIIEEEWAITPIRGPGLQDFLIRLVDYRSDINFESRPVIEIRSALDLHLYTRIDVCPIDVVDFNTIDPNQYPLNTLTDNNHYLYDLRGYAKPQMRVGVDTTIPWIGGGMPYIEVLTHYTDRRDPANTIYKRLTTIVLNDFIPDASSVTFYETTSSDPQIPSNFDDWAMGPGGNVWF